MVPHVTKVCDKVCLGKITDTEIHQYFCMLLDATCFLLHASISVSINIFIGLGDYWMIGFELSTSTKYDL